MRAAAVATVACVITTACGGDPEGGAPVDGATGDTTAVVTCEPGVPWAVAPPVLLGPTQETAAVALDGKIYVLGGFQGPQNVIAAVQVFDVAACAWSSGPPLPRAVHHANAAVLDGRIYVLGAMVEPTFVPINDVWSWAPATEAGWTPRAPLPAQSQRGAAVTGVLDGKIYVAGGLRGTAVSEVSIYDPALDTWTGGPPLPAARDHGCGGVIAGKLYVAGGRGGQIGSPSGRMFELAPGGAWVERATMPTARGGTACGVVGDRLIVVGGEGNPAAGSRGVFPQVESYDAAANAWTALAPMRTPRHGMGAAAWGGRLYVPGGADQQAFGAVATHEVLTP